MLCHASSADWPCICSELLEARCLRPARRCRALHGALFDCIDALPAAVTFRSMSGPRRCAKKAIVVCCRAQQTVYQRRHPCAPLAVGAHQIPLPSAPMVRLLGGSSDLTLVKHLQIVDRGNSAGRRARHLPLLPHCYAPCALRISVQNCADSPQQLMPQIHGGRHKSKPKLVYQRT